MAGIYAVISTGGKQYRVSAGERLRVERLAVEPGAAVEFDRVLLVGQGDSVRVGTPYVDGGRVSATVRSHGRRRKIQVIKFKRRKNYLRRQGHRQDYTELEITDIVPAAGSSAPPPPAPSSATSNEAVPQQPSHPRAG